MSRTVASWSGLGESVPRACGDEPDAILSYVNGLPVGGVGVPRACGDEPHCGTRLAV